MLSRLTRTTGRQRNRANPQVTDTKEYWRITLHYQFLDPLLSVLRDHLVKNEDRFLLLLLILINLNKLKQEDELIFMMLIGHICKPRKSLLLSKKYGKQGITDQVTPIHLCETLGLVSKKLVSEYLLYVENATLTFSFHWMQLYTSLIIPDKENYFWVDCV